jgi:hypothetical protein
MGDEQQLLAKLLSSGSMWESSSNPVRPQHLDGPHTTTIAPSSSTGANWWVYNSCFWLNGNCM